MTVHFYPIGIIIPSRTACIGIIGIQDRDYMRNRRTSLWDRIRDYCSDWQRTLTIAALVISVATGALWLFRDARSTFHFSGPAEGSLRVNINTATQDELESLPGIGPARAIQIIAGRPYASVDDMVRLDGIGPAQLESLRPFLTVAGDTEELPTN